MKLIDLIRILQRYPQDAEVFVNGKKIDRVTHDDLSPDIDMNEDHQIDIRS